ncbi:3',5'-cyclic-nucleotide phosphodiesterase [Sulfuriferula sp. AH1]|uniref:3',5'-cyclic-nucleotide phosphodiesterase n=1 Tax=Sulfuriferula sp. AH1 TaxID=1985873 RepID=UPI000B3B3DB5|nr:3',5'-cyclic-nucleotide phosphodiesterase [Sulfuriferula sp. AH1]ARU31202.1 3',5'-cyclic-nucleotide phosphodiesterase [Sulfuriferula sp. AH1]
MRLKILGCSAGIGGTRRTSALLLDDDILIDAGTGTGDLTLEEMARIDHVFLTHSHLDHSAFLPLLADASAFMRQRPLEVHALPETINALRENMLNGKLWPDYTIQPSMEKPYIRFHALTCNETIVLEKRRITPLPAKHSVPAVGYRLDSGTSSFVYSGDSTLCDAFWEALNAIDNLRYLMIETTFLNKLTKTAAPASGHMTANLLAQGLKQLKRPLNILITHMEPGKEGQTMAEIMTATGSHLPVAVAQGQIFNL